MVQIAEQLGLSLGRLALAYEASLLGISQAEVMAEMLRRYDIMLQSVQRGLDPNFTGLQLLPTCAGAIFRAEAEGRLSVRSLHTRAAARAMAVMHVDGAMGVVCAAPTGGSAGVIPGTLVTLAEERSLTREQLGLALLAAGSVGMILAIRGTFAAEVAGCQVEIGASAAMAAAAVVDAVGGTARQACHAAAISFQNTMGTVCDLLHGMVEIPCHTRNAAAAAAAFINADLVLGGYTNFIPLDETIDAVYAVGLAMPSELRCTSQGGIAITPSAQALMPGCSDPRVRRLQMTMRTAPLLYLSAADVRRALPMTDAIAAMREAFAQLSNGQVTLPARECLQTPDEHGVALVMSCHSIALQMFSLKTITVFRDNPQLGLPTIQSLVILTDGTTGSHLAVIDGASLTAIRTGAASGLATDLLARPDAAVVAVLGAGVQARSQLEAVCCVGAIRRACVYDAAPAAADRFAAEMTDASVGLSSARPARLKP